VQQTQEAGRDGYAAGRDLNVYPKPVTRFPNTYRSAATKMKYYRWAVRVYL